MLKTEIDTRSDGKSASCLATAATAARPCGAVTVPHGAPELLRKLMRRTGTVSAELTP